MDALANDPVLQGKINSAARVIEKCLEVYRKPAILCSFGKDSLLMLYMIRNYCSVDLPVVFFKQPHFARKFAFGDKMAAELELEVHSNIPPFGISLTSKNGKSELVHHFSLGKQTLMMPLGVQSIESKAKWLCATESLLSGPFGTFGWPWDVAFCGHKSSDVDPLQGQVPLSVDIHQIEGSCHLAYPLRHFTDQDVWRLTKAWDIPVNRLRYGNADQPQDDTENYFNEDYFPYCMKCCDPNQPDFVTCPKTGLEVTNIHRSIPQIDPKKAYCS